MGITAKLEQMFTFKYKTSFNNGLIEHEFDHVLIGHSNETPKINIDEVSDWRWSNIEYIKNIYENKSANQIDLFGENENQDII